jgi:DNA-directed RNA polymerase subunit F
MARKKLEEKYITNAEAMDTLESIEGEKSSFIRSVGEYIRDTTLLSSKDSRSLVEELVSGANLTEKDAVMLANVLPSDVAEVKALLSGGGRPFVTSEQADKIAEILAKYKSKGKRETPQVTDK